MAELTKFGVRILDDLGTPREMVELGVEAETLGFDSVQFPGDALRTDPWALTPIVGYKTSRIEIRLGGRTFTGSLSDVATYTATLDAITGGRVSVGSGLHNYDGMTWFGVSRTPAQAMQQTREEVDILRRLWHGERGPFETEYYHLSEKAFMRMPVLRADIPINVFPLGEEFCRLSGEIGDGSVPMVTPPESAELIMGAIRQGLESSVNPNRPFECCAMVWLAISEDRAEARDLLADAVAYFGTYLDPRALTVIGLNVDDFMPAYKRVLAGDKVGARAACTPEMLRTGIYGTPKDCIEKLEMIVNAGFNHISIGGPLGAKPADAMKLLSERVLPHFR